MLFVSRLSKLSYYSVVKVQNKLYYLVLYSEIFFDTKCTYPNKLLTMTIAGTLQSMRRSTSQKSFRVIRLTAPSGVQLGFLHRSLHSLISELCPF